MTSITFGGGDYYDDDDDDDNVSNFLCLLRLGQAENQDWKVLQGCRVERDRR